MADQLGTSPELNSSPTFSRINPVAGLTYKYAPWLNYYAGYSESNRAPTPLELGCSDPVRPCLIEGALVSDPPLKQVVGKTYETGLRGTVDLNPGRFDWKLGVFRTDTSDDILRLASVIQGRGFFTNVAATRRQGLEAGVEYRAGPWTAYAGYSFIDATFQFTGDLASPNNPLADADGNIHVTPGKRIPMIPLHQFKVGADYAVTPLWTVGGNMVAVGSQYFVGDEANQNPKLPAYAVFNLRTTYQVSKNVQVFGFINNLFNKKYGLYGTFFAPQGVANAGLPITLTDQRTEVPGQPFSIYAGVRMKL
jgi:iron complex outermembrane receptor protein